MKNIYKLISLLLTALMLLGSLSAVFTVGVLADETVEEGDSSTGETTETPDIVIREDIDYTKTIYSTPEEKLATMRLAFEKDNYQLYIDDYSGEVACINKVTGEKLFTNPYDVGASSGNTNTKNEILSQIIVRFTDTQGQSKVFTSYEEAALREQIVTEQIKNGIRVEYTIGREMSKSLVPRLITKERFENMILAAAYEAFGDELYNDNTQNQEVFDFQRLLEYYVFYDKEQITSDRALAAILKDYPIVDRMPVYVFNPKASEAEIARCEEMIITYCPDYTYEELEYDHSLTEYESEDENPPVFRMALEYKIDPDGLSVRLPANGIRFNESLYTLSSIEVLPYMGAGNSGYAGYNFFPDGSGALFDYEDLNTSQTRSILGKVYGTDFAYHEITGKYQKTIRYPVFGVVENSTYYTYTQTDVDSGEVIAEDKISGAMVEAVKAYIGGETPRVFKGSAGTLSSMYSGIIYNTEATEKLVEDKRGFVAIIEEGDALASLTTYHAGPLSDYNTIKMQFTPRPKDSYNLQDSISVGTNSQWTVVSDRKYVGGYKMKYIMLSETKPEAEGKTYDASWFGMAVAYRDYLTKNNILSKISEEKLTEDIPLYIETFGAVETVEKILSVPVDVMAPLTTFENIVQMYNELSEQGMKNINFKLTGYANGGMYSTVPGKLKFEKAVGGNEGFQKLLDEAVRINAEDGNNKFGIFPDFDFAYSDIDELFDGFDASKHAAKTIDDRYANFREYSATQQKYMNYYKLVISPAYFSVFYEKLTDNYANKFDNVTGISVSTLGDTLNSDFDEDEPYNREDSKAFTIKAFEYLDENYDEVMTSGGNYYVWKYADHILDVALDSSRYNFSSHSVPFAGVVLHGSVSFAGEPINMEGDINYAILKAIENGASPYFILSYQNTQALKEYSDLSNYYSIRYDIWKKDIGDVYGTLNNALSDVQDKYIVNHEFLSGERVPDSDELEADILADYLARLEEEQNAADILAKEILLAANTARENGRAAEAYVMDALVDALRYYGTQNSNAASAMKFDEDYYEQAKLAYKLYTPTRKYAKFKSSKDANELALYNEYLQAKTIFEAVTNYNMDYQDCLDAYNSALASYEAIVGEYVPDNKIANTKSNISSQYSKYVNSKTAEDKAASLAKIDELLAENGDAIAVYNKYNAATQALKMVTDSYFVLDFDTCYAAALKVEEYGYFSSASYKKAALAEDAEAIVVENYANYVNSTDAVSALVESSKRSTSKGSVDNYVVALAERDAIVELGYNNSTDATELGYYNSAVSAVARTRTTAINAVARIQGANYNNLVELYETAVEQLELAVEAIEVVATAEGNTIVWNEESEEFLAVSNEDELSMLTLQAIERAKTVHRYIYGLSEDVMFQEIEDGRPSNLVWNGKSLKYNKDATGQRIYFAGSEENGYSYFVLQPNSESGEDELVIYHKGTKTGAKIGELDVYEYSAGLVKYYYTATIESGYTYYTYNKGFETYFPRESVELGGELFYTLADGTEIFLDGETYYSVNADGSYTRYNYNVSIKDCFDQSVQTAEALKADATAVVALGGDDSFATAVQARIDRSNAGNKQEEEIVEEEAVISRYATENIVAVTYGDDMNDRYKTIILNYNNYTVRVVYDNIEYTVPAYEFVIIKN